MVKFERVRDSGINNESDSESSIYLSESDSSSNLELFQESEVMVNEVAQPAAAAEQLRLADATAKLMPFMPVFKADTLATLDVKAKDIDRQIANYNRRFKLWRDMIHLDLPNKVWFSAWRSNLNNEALDVLDKLTFAADENGDDYELVSKKLLEHLTNKRGSKYTSRVFFRNIRQSDNEKFASFLQRLKTAAAPCRWKEEQKNESMIEQIIAGHKDERVRAILFDLESDELDKYVRKCEALEIANIQASQVAKPSTSTAGQPVDAVNHNRGNPYNRGRGMPRGNHLRGRGIYRGRGNYGGNNQSRCGWCGGMSHGVNNNERLVYCKARNHTCAKCSCKGHFEQCCQNSKKEHKNAPQPLPTHHVRNEDNQEDSESAEQQLLYPEDEMDEYESSHAMTAEELQSLSDQYLNSPDAVDNVSTAKREFFANLAKLGRPRAWYEVVSFSQGNLQMKVDSGSSVNTLPWSEFLKTGLKTEDIKPTAVTLISYSNHTIKPKGVIQATIWVRGTKIKDNFIVLEGEGIPLLGLGTGRALGLFNVARESKLEYNRKPKAGFEKTFALGLHAEPVDIQLKPGVKPVCVPSRRIPLRLKDRVKAELDRMLALGVIRPVNHPTEWCHPMLATDKKQKNGKVRVCIDPKFLNPFIKRAMYQLPSIDSLLSELGEARVFATLDLESGFWQVPLTERSSEILTLPRLTAGSNTHAYPSESRQRQKNSTAG